MAYIIQEVPAIISVAGKARRKRIVKEKMVIGPSQRIPIHKRPSMLAQPPQRVQVAYRLKVRERQIAKAILDEMQRIHDATTVATNVVDKAIQDALNSFYFLG